MRESGPLSRMPGTLAASVSLSNDAHWLPQPALWELHFLHWSLGWDSPLRGGTSEPERALLIFNTGPPAPPGLRPSHQSLHGVFFMH